MLGATGKLDGHVSHGRLARLVAWRPSIKASLIGLFATIVIVSVGQGLFGLAQLRSTNSRLATITNQWLPSVDRANRVNVLINDVRTKQYRFFVSTDLDYAAAEQNLARGLSALAQARRSFEESVSSPAEREAYERFSDRWSAYARLWQEIPVLLRSGQRDKASGIFKNEMFHVSDEASAALDDVIDIVRAGAAEASAEASADYRSALTLSLIAFGSAVLLSASAIAYSVRRVALPLKAITAALVRLADGDRRVVLPQVTRQDELGAMLRALDVFRATMFQLELAHEQTRKAQVEAQTLAFHDALTGLPNRRRFDEALRSVTETPPRAGGTHAVFVLDLNDFKRINDVFGHPAGDDVLIEVGSRLNRAVAAGDLVARLGGDEFAVLAPHLRGAEAAVDVAMRIMEALSAPIAATGREHRVGTSIGISLFPQDGDNTADLLRKADLALYRAKMTKGDSNCAMRFFELEMDVHVRERDTLERELRTAIAEGSIRPFYQPLVELQGGQIVAFEALARWTSPTLGIVGPARFITVAEDSGLIASLTDLLLEQACADAVQWPPSVQLAFNVSGALLRDKTFGLRVMSILGRTGLPPRRLELEITENVLVRDLNAAGEVLSPLREAGIQIALDDFGTGYSSLYHLRSFRPDKIKIDRSFISAMARDSDSAAIVQAMVGLGSGLGVRVTAEGIETLEQEELLRELGCDQGQGYLFSAAVSSKDAAAFVSAGDNGLGVAAMRAHDGAG